MSLDLLYDLLLDFTLMKVSLIYSMPMIGNTVMGYC